MEQIYINGSFEDEWETLPAYPGTHLRNQRPDRWMLTVVAPGDNLFDSNDIASGYPECVHKMCKQLPQDECLGGENALILDGNVTYKIFSAHEAFGAMLTQMVLGAKVGSNSRFVVRIQIHNHKADADMYGAEVWVGSGRVGSWHNLSELVDHEFVTFTVETPISPNGHVLQIAVKSKWNKPVDFFIDEVQFYVDELDTDPPDPPGDECDCDVIIARLDTLEEQVFGLLARVGELEDAVFPDLITMADYWFNTTGGCIVEKMHDGRTQPVWALPGGCIQKGNALEMWVVTERDVIQVADTSPGPDSQGRERYYVINSGHGSLWMPGQVLVGNMYQGPNHEVQFRSIEDCSPMEENSGIAGINVSIVSQGPMTFNAFGQNIRFNDVVTLIGNGETHHFARGYGRVGWSHGEAFSEVVEIYHDDTITRPAVRIPACATELLGNCVGVHRDHQPCLKKQKPL